MNRRQFLKNVYKVSGVVGLMNIGLSLDQAKCFGDAGIMGGIANQTVESGGCETESLDSSCDASGSTYSLDTEANGQEIIATVTGKVSSIDIWIQFTTGGEIEVRWGPDADLTTTYTASETVTVGSGEGVSWKNIPFTTKGDIAGSTIYYLGIIENSGDVRTAGGSTDTCAGVQRRFAGATGWDMSSISATTDMKYRINLCG